MLISLDIDNAPKSTLTVNIDNTNNVFDDILISVQNVANNWIVNILPKEEHISIIELLGATVEIKNLEVEYYVQLEFTTKVEPMS